VGTVPCFGLADAICLPLQVCLFWS
jgi:hypothetical protein